MIDQKLSFNRALLWILVSTLLISGSAFMGWLYFQHVKARRVQDDQYRIVAIIQSTPQVETLRTVYLAELLNLSFDRPVNLYQFNVQSAIRTLLDYPLIKHATIKKILPGTLYIHYQMRIPIAYLGDYSNTVIDEEGYLFPYRPFFTPKRLPIIYLGVAKEECMWGGCLKEHVLLKLAFEILQQFHQLKQEDFYLKQIDVAQAEADSYGQRQIVLLLERGSQDRRDFSLHSIYLRLSTDHYKQDLANYCHLQELLFNAENEKMAKCREVMIDLRIPHLAFIKSGS